MNSPQNLTPLVLLEDEPIFSFNQDRLGVRQYADVIASAALGTTGPFTIGVYGRWGEGKTSLLRCAESMLSARAGAHDSSQPKGLLYPHVITVWFNAWQFEREDQILVPLVAAIQRAVLRRLAVDPKFLSRLTTHGRGFVKRLFRGGNRLLSAVSVSTSVEGNLPFVGKAGIEVDLSGEQVSNAVKELCEPEKAPDTSMLEERINGCLHLAIFDAMDESYSECIAGSKQSIGNYPRIVVFIDDLDRCQPDKAFQVIEAIKVALAQQGFIFVLALNKPIVDAYVETMWKGRISARFSEHAARYLDKIIQLPLYVRSHEKGFESFVDDLLDVRLKRAVNEETLSVFESVRDHLGVTTGFGPRALVRRINTLLVDQRLRPPVSGSDPRDVQDLEDSDFLGLCLVQRTLLDELDDRSVRLFASDDSLCAELSKTSPGEAYERRVVGVADSSEGVVNPQEEAKFQTVADRSRAVVLDLLNRLDTSEAARYVLSTEHGKRWLRSRACRDLVTDFVASRPETTRSDGDDIARQQLQAPAIGPTVSVHAASSPLAPNLIKSDKEWLEQQALIERAVRRIVELGVGQKLTPEHWASVQRLAFFDQPITDCGAVILALPRTGLHRLAALYLGGTKITDVGVGMIAAKESNLTSLHTLDLSFTQTTDAGIAAMMTQDSALRNLRRLAVTGTPVSERAIAELRAVRPGLSVIRT